MSGLDTERCRGVYVLEAMLVYLILSTLSPSLSIDLIPTLRVQSLLFGCFVFQKSYMGLLSGEVDVCLWKSP
jgi:hypothetical protein